MQNVFEGSPSLGQDEDAAETPAFDLSNFLREISSTQTSFKDPDILDKYVNALLRKHPLTLIEYYPINHDRNMFAFFQSLSNHPLSAGKKIDKEHFEEQNLARK